MDLICLIRPALGMCTEVLCDKVMEIWYKSYTVALTRTGLDKLVMKMCNVLKK